MCCDCLNMKWKCVCIYVYVCVDGSVDVEEAHALKDGLISLSHIHSIILSNPSILCAPT